MKILITGGCGFVGSNLAVLFKQFYTDVEVYCLDNLSRRGSEINLKKILASGGQFVHGDVRIKTDFDQIPIFIKEGAINQQQFDQSQTTLDTAIATLEARQAAVAEIRLQAKS